MDVEAVRPLFEMRSPGGGPRTCYDVSNDGQRFVHSKAEDQRGSAALTLVMNWPALKRASKRPM